jgi:flagellar P-ring protein precursor FlgI
MTNVLKIAITAAIVVALCSASFADEPTMRLKDISQIEGARSNQLVGYGLIVGLNGTGDSQQVAFTNQSIVNMLLKFGVSVSGSVTVKNAAAVMVTADLPAFQRPGSKIDVVVSSLGDCSSLQGGTLLQTPLQAADGNVYAVAQGEMSIGGFRAGGGGNNVSKNHATAGRIPGGALVERDVPATLSDGRTITVFLNNPDFATAARAAQAINTALGQGSAVAQDASTIKVTPPNGNLVSTLAIVGDLQVEESSVARVIVNERTGTVVIGGNVKLSAAAIAHGDLTVEISTKKTVVQPEALSKGKTTVVPDVTTKVSEQKSGLMYLDPGTSLEDLVEALNQLKVTPRDIIAILQSLKQAGALHAEIEVI